MRIKKFSFNAVIVSVSGARSHGDVIKAVTISLELYVLYFGRLAGVLTLFSFYSFRPPICDISFFVVPHYTFRYAG